MIGAAPPGAVLLDTCAVIWVAGGEAIAPSAMDALAGALMRHGGFVSPISAWEIGLLARPPRGGPPRYRFLPDPATWFREFLASPGIALASFTPGMAAEATALPGELHGDPADRLLIATARHLDVPILTRDRLILAYAEAGHVRAIAC